MRKILVVMGTVLLSVSLSSAAKGQNTASAKEVITKVRQAAAVLAKTHDLAQFNRKQSPWVWKDSYIFVINCNKQVIAAHPVKAQLIGTSIGSIRSVSGDKPFPHPTRFCQAARSPSGVWFQYWWPKPGAKIDSRKISYSLGVKGTPYVVGAGFYDSRDSTAQLAKLTRRK